jgi:F0F1-type ATP synthase epsilon subunit
VLQCFNGEKQTRFALHDGFVTVDADVIRIVCEVAESTRDIDVERAKRARERAEDRLKGKQEDTDFRRAEAALHRAVAASPPLRVISELPQYIKAPMWSLFYCPRCGFHI